VKFRIARKIAIAAPVGLAIVIPTGSTLAATSQQLPPALGAPTATVTTGSFQFGEAHVSWTVPQEPVIPAITRYQAKAVEAPSQKCKVKAAEDSCDVAGLVNGVAYTFEVRARNASGWGPWSAASDPATPLGAPPPPASIHVTTGNATAEISWTAPTSDGGAAIDSYTVGIRNSAKILCTSSSITPCDASGLRNGKSYRFVVSAHNSYGSGAPKISRPNVPSTIPDAATGVGGFPGNGSVLVAWNPPAFNGGSPITKYQVFNWATDQRVCGTTSTNCIVRNLTNGWKYRFYVVAFNVRGSGPPSAPSRAIKPSTTPSEPIGVHLEAGDGYVNLGWSPPSSTGGLPIDYYLAVVIGNPGLSCQSSAPACAITGLQDGTAYAFQVFAHNADGFGPPATTGYITPNPQPVVVARFYGNGDQSPPAFGIPANASRWTESWSYNSCPFDYGNFITFIDKLDGDGFTSDSGVNELGAGGSGTNYYYDTGVFQVQVISECNWTDTITYYPPGT
jgi:Fibronectin type III domain